ncbi:optineurin-like isoform X2 [Euwallacea fornicatus]|uniref:optineurin-like isoform X2 n=2 Tax=Euwallacea fornicatus TaxID=995702 RepID=UPI00338DB374
MAVNDLAPLFQIPPEPLPVPVTDTLSSSPDEQSFVVIGKFSEDFSEASILAESRQEIEDAIRQTEESEERMQMNQSKYPQPSLMKINIKSSPVVEPDEQLPRDLSHCTVTNGFSKEEKNVPLVGSAENSQLDHEDKGMISIISFSPSDFQSEEIQAKVFQLIEENTNLRDTVIQNNKNMKAQYEKVLTWQNDAEKVQEAHKQKFLEAKKMITTLKEEVASLKQENKKLEASLQGKLCQTTENNLREFELDIANRKIKDLEEAMQKFTVSSDEKQETLKTKEALNQLQERSRAALVKLEEEQRLRVKSEEALMDLQIQLGQIKAKNESMDPSQLTRTEEKLQRYEKELENAYKKIAQLEKGNEAEKRELEVTKENLLVSKMTNDRANQEIQSLRAQLLNTTQATDIISKRHNDAEQALMEREYMASQLDATRLKLMDAVTRIAQLEQQLAEINSENDVLGMREREEQAKVEAWMAKQKIATLEKKLQESTLPATVSQEFPELAYVRQQLMQTQIALTQCEQLRVAAEAKATSASKENAQLKMQLENRESEDDSFALKTQLDVYKTDFEAEREAKEDVKREKKKIAEDLQHLHRRNQQLQEEIEILRRDKCAVTRPNTESSSTSSAAGSPMPLRYTCPICNVQFRSLKLVQDHLETCICHEPW